MKNKKKMTLRTKIMLSLLSIVAILLVSNIISIIEFTKMRSAVADILIHEEILRSEDTRNDGEVAFQNDMENSQPEEVVSDDIDDTEAIENIDEVLRHSEVSEESCEPQEEKSSISEELESLVQDYYRSLFPGVVATFAGIMLVLMLLYFILTMYVNPLRRMVDSLEAFRLSHKPYKYEFQGDDELAKLNEGILEITENNLDLRRRNKELKNR